MRRAQSSHVLTTPLPGVTIGSVGAYRSRLPERCVRYFACVTYSGEEWIHFPLPAESCCRWWPMRAGTVDLKGGVGGGGGAVGVSAVASGKLEQL